MDRPIIQNWRFLLAAAIFAALGVLNFYDPGTVSWWGLYKYSWIVNLLAAGFFVWAAIQKPKTK
jgi:hypothetical protein